MSSLSSAMSACRHCCGGKQAVGIQCQEQQTGDWVVLAAFGRSGGVFLGQWQARVFSFDVP